MQNTLPILIMLFLVRFIPLAIMVVFPSYWWIGFGAYVVIATNTTLAWLRLSPRHSRLNSSFLIEWELFSKLPFVLGIFYLTPMHVTVVVSIPMSHVYLVFISIIMMIWEMVVAEWICARLKRYKNTKWG